MGQLQTVMMTTFEHAKLTLTEEDLDDAIGLVDAAADEARRLSEVCEGTGCLIAADGDEGGPAGSFRSADTLSTLMFSLAHSFDTLAAMASVGGDAWQERRRRQAAKTVECSADNADHRAVSPVDTDRTAEPDTGLEARESVDILSNDRQVVALEAACEIEALCNTLRGAVTPNADMEHLVVRGLAARINSLASAVMDAMGDASVTTDEIAKRVGVEIEEVRP